MSAAPLTIGYQVAIEIASSGKTTVVERRFMTPFIGRVRTMALRVAGAVRIIKITPLHESDSTAGKLL